MIFGCVVISVVPNVFHAFCVLTKVVSRNKSKPSSKPSGEILVESSGDDSNRILGFPLFSWSEYMNVIDEFIEGHRHQQ